MFTSMFVLTILLCSVCILLYLGCIIVGIYRGWLYKKTSRAVYINHAWQVIKVKNISYIRTFNFFDSRNLHFNN